METIMTNPSKTALVPIVLRDCLISSWRWHLTAAAGSLGTVAVLGRSSCLLVGGKNGNGKPSVYR